MTCPPRHRRQDRYLQQSDSQGHQAIPEKPEFSTILQSNVAPTLEPTPGKTEVQKPAISHDKDLGKVFK